MFDNLEGFKENLLKWVSRKMLLPANFHSQVDGLEDFGDIYDDVSLCFKLNYLPDHLARVQLKQKVTIALMENLQKQVERQESILEEWETLYQDSLEKLQAVLEEEEANQEIIRRGWEEFCQCEEALERAQKFHQMLMESIHIFQSTLKEEDKLMEVWLGNLLNNIEEELVTHPVVSLNNRSQITELKVRTRLLQLKEPPPMTAKGRIKDEALKNHLALISSAKKRIEVVSDEPKLEPIKTLQSEEPQWPATEESQPIVAESQEERVTNKEAEDALDSIRNFVFLARFNRFQVKEVLDELLRNQMNLDKDVKFQNKMLNFKLASSELFHPDGRLKFEAVEEMMSRFNDESPLNAENLAQYLAEKAGLELNDLLMEQLAGAIAISVNFDDWVDLSAEPKSLAKEFEQYLDECLDDVDKMEILEKLDAMTLKAKSAAQAAEVHHSLRNRLDELNLWVAERMEEKPRHERDDALAFRQTVEERCRTRMAELVSRGLSQSDVTE